MKYAARTAAIVIGICAATTVVGEPKQPTDKFELAASAIARAEQAGGTDAAPLELATARDKLALAQKLAQKSSGFVASTRLAEEAEAAADVAEARARAMKAQKAAAELDKSLEALRSEAQAHG